MPASKESLAIYKAVVANKDKIPRVIGNISPDQVDNLEKEIGRILTKFKYNRYTEGRKYGHLACILTQMAHWTVINEAVWAYDTPQDQGVKDPNTVANVTEDRDPKWKECTQERMRTIKSTWG